MGFDLGQIGSKLSSAGKWVVNNLPTITSLGGSVMGLFGTKGNSAASSFAYSKALQEHQYELERQSRQTAYQDTRYSLEQAGYNPMLAVGSQSGSLPVGNQMDVTDPKIERMNTFLNASSALADIAVKKAQARNIEADTQNKPFESPLKLIGDLITGGNSDKAKKIVSSMIVGKNYDSGSSATSSFINDHPTTMAVLRSLKRGDYVGAKRAIDSRTKRKLRSSRSHSALSGKPSDIPSEWWYDGEPYVGKW